MPLELNRDNLERLVMEGLTLEQLAQTFGCSPRTIGRRKLQWNLSSGEEYGILIAQIREGVKEIQRECKKHGMTRHRAYSGRFRCSECCREHMRGKPSLTIQWKLVEIEARGGKCECCGKSPHPRALHFHHREPEQKEFRVSKLSAGRERFESEIAKCDLICANCHMEHELSVARSRLRRKTSLKKTISDCVTALRQHRKAVIVKHAGGKCQLCEYSAEGSLQFHHVDASNKLFLLSGSGITKSAEKVSHEFQKCVCLCANCHAEVEAGAKESPRPNVLSDEQRLHLVSDLLRGGRKG